MNRKDYRQMMQVKKRNANYAKMTILASLGLGVALASSTTVKAETREWTPNSSTTIKQGDKQYTIKWGDYLALISKDSGLTIETLMKLNDSIVNANLIYEGNIIYFGDGVNVVVKDAQGNTIASTPLTEADKEGIKQADAKKVNRASKTDNKKSDDLKVQVNNNGNGTGTVTRPNTTIPATPDTKEVSMKVYYLQVVSEDNLEEAVILKEETIKVKKGEKITVNAKEFENMNLISQPSMTIVAEENAEIIFDYVHKDARAITVRSITEDGEILNEFIEQDFDILVGEEISYVAGEFEDYEVVGNKEKSITVNTDNSKNIIEFVYRKKAVLPVEKVTVTIEHKGTDGVDLSRETKQVEKDSTITEKALDFSDRGYELIGDSTQTIKADKDSTITFEYKKTDTKPEVEKVSVWVKYVDSDGTLIEDDNISAEKGEKFIAEAKDFSSKGFILDDSATKEIIAGAGSVITFKYKYSIPLEDIAILTTRYVDEEGNEIAESTQQEVKIGYTYVSYPINVPGYEEIDYAGRIGEMVAGGVTEIIVYKKLDDTKPQYTYETIKVNIDTDGNILTSTEGYTPVSESTDDGVMTDTANGGIHTVYTNTIVWKKDV